MCTFICSIFARFAEDPEQLPESFVEILSWVISNLARFKPHCDVQKVCVCVYVCVCVCVCVCMCVCLHVRTYIRDIACL